MQQYYPSFGQQFVYASNEDEALLDGSGCLGDTTTDPVGATFDAVYNGDFNYVVWNDQFYDDPQIEGCTTSCSSPWGHSKGMLAWNADGDGLVMQVTTPSWPAAGNKSSPRKTDGNTLGCVKDNNLLVSQHFFALRLSKDDVVKVLTALANASIVTDPANPQIVHNGGPADIRQLVGALGRQSASRTYITATLSSGVVLISKPSNLHVPPWQMVSAILGGTSLRTATWWTDPEINSTTESSTVGCWDTSLGKPGAVEIATTGQLEEPDTRPHRRGGSRLQPCQDRRFHLRHRSLCHLRRYESAGHSLRPQLRQQPERTRRTFLCPQKPETPRQYRAIDLRGIGAGARRQSN